MAACVGALSIGVTGHSKDTVSPWTVKGAGHLEAARESYQTIVDQGGWRQIRAGGILDLGAQDTRIADLRARLIKTGDLAPTPASPFIFDGDVAAAVRSFQERHGLTPSGAVDDETLDALNVSARERLAAIDLNIDRLNDSPIGRHESYVVVNIAAALLEVVDEGAVVRRHRAVVGKTYRKTPVLSSMITHIDFNPNWHVPVNVARWDIIPRIRRNPHFLKDEKFSVWRVDGEEWTRVEAQSIDWTQNNLHQEYRFTQLRGPQNSLGGVIVRFPNDDAIFLHDTPKQHLFIGDNRAHSSGCVRVEQIDELAGWLLRGKRQWSSTRISQTRAGGKATQARLNTKIPVHLIYLTAWAGADANVHFRRDIYDKDKTADKVAAAKSR
jgi:murein L,D-transpeptidase YcbB/YkuD